MARYMTDAEITKSLECCEANESYNPNCDECPYFHKAKDNDECYRTVRKLALDLINRQKVEIEMLQAKNKRFADIGKMYSEVRAEAIEEFTERFESKLNCIPQHHFTLAQVLFDLDKTKKEVVGELK